MRSVLLSSFAAMSSNVVGCKGKKAELFEDKLMTVPYIGTEIQIINGERDAITGIIEPVLRFDQSKYMA